MSNLEDVRRALSGLRLRLASGQISREEYQSIRETLLTDLTPAERSDLGPESPTPVPGRPGPSAGETRFPDRRLDAIVEGMVIGGRYQVRALIGRGGMAAVYRVADLELDGAERALKVLSPTAAGTAGTSDAGSLVARFKQEVQLGQEKLRHDNIIAIYGYGREGDGPDALHYAVMELVEGWDLKAVVEERRRGGHDPALTPDEISSILRQLAEALAFAHGRGVVHRDIKPSNVLMVWRNGEWHVKLGDFGIARLIEGPALTTSTGAGPMTLDYSAPEQRGSVAYKVGTWSDVYQFGLVAYELFQAFSGRRWDPSSPNNEFPAWVPRSVVSVVRRCLRFNPEERPHDAAALVAVLTNAGTPAEHNDVQHQTQQPRGSVRQGVESGAAAPPAKRRGTFRVALVGAVALVLVYLLGNSLLALTRRGAVNPETRTESAVNRIDPDLAPSQQDIGESVERSTADHAAAPSADLSLPPDPSPIPAIEEKPLLVVTARGGATVEVDGAYLDSGENLSFPLAPGYHSVKATRNGQVVLSRQVLVTEDGATIEVPELAAREKTGSSGASPVSGRSTKTATNESGVTDENGFTFISGDGSASGVKSNSLGRRSTEASTVSTPNPPRYAIFLNFVRSPSRTCTSKIVRTLQSAFSTRGLQALENPTGPEIDALRAMLGSRTVTLYDSDFATAMQNADAAYVATMHVDALGELQIRCYLQGRYTGDIQLSNACNFYEGWSGRFFKDAGDFGRETRIN